MAQNPAINQDALDVITNELQNLHLHDHDNLQRFRVKRSVVRVTDRPYLLSIPNYLDAEFYNRLGEKLEIQAEPHNFVPRRSNGYRSPRNFVRMLIANDDATEAAVQKLFEKQYELIWHTQTGDPDQFSFYGFCQDVPDGVMTYNTRRAHVISRLYDAQERLHEIRSQTFRQLCPPVYVRTQVGRRWTWKKWICNNSRSIFVVENGSANINWITNAPLRNYVTAHSMRNHGGENFPNKKRHLYWAVLEEDDFHDNQPHGDNLGTTQVYVGKAARGIKNRWVGSQDSSHCRNMELSRNVMYNMMNYDPDVLARKQLVDLRFLLHKAYNQEGENSGLFIMQLRPGDKLNDAEKQHIAGIKLSDTFTLHPKDMNYGMNS